MTDRTSDTGPAALREALTSLRTDRHPEDNGLTYNDGWNDALDSVLPRLGDVVDDLAALPAPDPAPVEEALGKLPPGPYTVSWPDHQGGLFSLWGRQGTPPDFTDGWAIPLVASGVDTAINALADLLNALAAQRGRSAAEGPSPHDVAIKRGREM